MRVDGFRMESESGRRKLRNRRAARIGLIGKLIGIRHQVGVGVGAVVLRHDTGKRRVGLSGDGVVGVVGRGVRSRSGSVRVLHNEEIVENGKKSLDNGKESVDNGEENVGSSENVETTKRRLWSGEGRRGDRESRRGDADANSRLNP